MQSADGPLASVMRSVVEYATQADITPVAEGVETQEQATKMRGLGIEVMQGFLLQRPQSLADAEHTIEAQAQATGPVFSDAIAPQR